MEIVKNEDGEEFFVIKAKVQISYVAQFNDALIYIPSSEFTQCLEATLGAKIADGETNPFWKVVETKGTPR